jgi:hypothetical protein
MIHTYINKIHISIYNALFQKAAFSPINARIHAVRALSSQSHPPAEEKQEKKRGGGGEMGGLRFRVYVYVYVYIYTHSHTHTHTHIWGWRV